MKCGQVGKKAYIYHHTSPTSNRTQSNNAHVENKNRNIIKQNIVNSKCFNGSQNFYSWHNMYYNDNIILYVCINVYCRLLVHIKTMYKTSFIAMQLSKIYTQ